MSEPQNTTIPSGYKHCPGCGQVLPAEAFSRCKRQGLQSRCKPCVRARRLAQADIIRAKDRARYAANREHRRAIRKAWYAANPEKKKQWDKTYRETHPEMVRRHTHRTNHKRRAKLRGAWVEHVDIEVLYERDKGICSLCHRPCRQQDASIDHIVPISLGGEHSYKNTALAHLKCNQKKLDHAVPQQTRLF